jgi:hypothetical protein
LHIIGSWSLESSGKGTREERNLEIAAQTQYIKLNKLQCLMKLNASLKNSSFQILKRNEAFWKIKDKT